MLLEESVVMRAFTVFRELTRNGFVEGETFEEYSSESQIRRLVEAYAEEVDCKVVAAGDRLYLVPTTKLSPFHITNETMKKTYLKSNATNADIYTMYLATLVLFGEFYDSYATREATRDFIQIDDWVRAVTKRIDFLKEHDLEQLKELEHEYSYNWIQIVEKWDSLDDYKETAKRQSGQTQSRLSFIDSVQRFLKDQELVMEIGNGELRLTEKAKTIVQSYFMDYEYNRGILDFLYQHEYKEEEED
ncbi:hypothetical protein JCM9140_1357 [Halalkalibacter wakoensis JCM 9140]|uniref:Non-ribosomal peptide synthetase module n=1 Tax=Halalkalibacter wakoensis JCM 9140 TaxID=1236970 RepID=W4PZU9_9BACI|nr:DUF6063 family protein [Halalkalibacter wakoensis]GAE25366.1 hypothetical protein JCM9140_1357 [Halalkalibacter wakoensis JCM 9140]